MAVTMERFNEGLTYQQYVDQMTQNKERFLENYQHFTLTPEDTAFFQHLSESLNVLMIAEDWCGDVIAGLPIIGKMLDVAGSKLNVRVFLRDQNEDLMNQYLKEGKYKSIPVVVVFDQHMHELGHFIERPAAQTQEQGQARNDFFAQHPELNTAANTEFGDLSPEARQAWGAASVQMRTQRADAWNQMLVDELKKLMSGVPA